MKKSFSAPECNMTFLEICDVISTSGLTTETKPVDELPDIDPDE